ncbi:MAG: hypothetical protein ABXS92_02635 [Sulfurimonas sp.]
MQYQAVTQLDPQKEGETYRFGHAYNPSRGTIDDLIETFWQIKESGQISDGYFFAIYSALAAESNGDEFLQKLQTIISNYNSDVNAMYQLYTNASFNQKHNVLLVAHSQGNLFGNKMYTLLNEDQKAKFRMVSVATPANSVAGSGPYATASGDYVINPIPGALSSNVDGFGHTFISTYLNGSINAPRQIALYVKNAYDNLMQTATCDQYRYFVWIAYQCPVRNAQELVVDIYGMAENAPYPYQKELLLTESRTRMPKDSHGNCSVSGDDVWSYWSEYDRNGCYAYNLEDTAGSSRSVDTVKGNVYTNGYLCTRYQISDELADTLKSMESE